MRRCDCCNGVDNVTPLEIRNRPGQTALSYRIGTHSSFLESMIALLSSTCVGQEDACSEAAGKFPLRDNLKTRELSDPSIAFLDAWATVADVLTFYQERIANEGFISTAQQRRSLHEISSLIGYAPRPGLSASVVLAFEVEKPVVTTDGVTVARRIPNGGVLIPAGTAVESTPSSGTDEESQTFETSQDFVAFEPWNAMQLRTTQPQCITADNLYKLSVLYLKGTGSGLKLNDLIYIQVPTVSLPVGYQVTKIEELVEPQITKLSIVCIDIAPASPTPAVEKPPCPPIDLSTPRENRDKNIRPTVFRFKTRCAVFGHNAPSRETRVTQADVDALNLQVANAIPSPPVPGYAEPWKSVIAAALSTFYGDVKSSVRISIGSFFPKIFPCLVTKSPDAERPNVIHLDGDFPAILSKSYLAIQGLQLQPPKLFEVTSSKIFPRTAYRLSGTTTRVELTSDWWDPLTPVADPADNPFRNIQFTSVYCESEFLELAEEPLDSWTQNESPACCPAHGEVLTVDQLKRSLLLDSYVPGLMQGQTLVIQGQRIVNDIAATDVSSEIVIIDRVKHVIQCCVYGDRLVTRLFFQSEIQRYLRSSVRIRGNLVEATHGKSQRESIGDGQGQIEFLKHQLTSAPVSQLPVPNESGRANELQVYVEDVEWQEALSITGKQPIDRIYLALRDETQRMTIAFGDGKSGARPPTGHDNIVARYRTGVGVRGNIPSGRIDQVASSSLGIRSVVNPSPSTGGADADELWQTRQRAPLSVTAFNRLVSLSDFRDFALSYAGIGKAHAVRGRALGNVYLTIAANHSGSILETSKLFINLKQALAHFGSDVGVVLKDRNINFLAIHAKVEIDPDRLWEVVEQQIQTALLDKFSYANAQFRQPLYASDAYATIQRVLGVRHVELLGFKNVDPDDPNLSSATATFGRVDSIALRGANPAMLCYLTPDKKVTLKLERIES